MAKDRFNDDARWRCPVIRAESVTRIAGADLGFGRMTGKAVRMSLNTNWDRLRSSGRLMAKCAALLGQALAADMRGMVKLHVETFLKGLRKRLHRHRNRLQIAVTHAAYLRFVVREFGHVAANARIMSGKLQIRRTDLAAMACAAISRVVFRNAMRKLSEITVRDAGRLRLLSFSRGDCGSRILRLLQATRGKNNQSRQNKGRFQRFLCIVAASHINDSDGWAVSENGRSPACGKRHTGKQAVFRQRPFRVWRSRFLCHYRDTNSCCTSKSAHPRPS